MLGFAAAQVAFRVILLCTIWTSNSCKLFRLFLNDMTAVSYTQEPALAVQYHLIDDHVLFMPVGLRSIFPQRVPNCNFFPHHLNIQVLCLGLQNKLLRRIMFLHLLLQVIDPHSVYMRFWDLILDAWLATTCGLVFRDLCLRWAWVKTCWNVAQCIVCLCWISLYMR